MQTQKEVAALIKQHTQATGQLETLDRACNDEVTHSNTQISAYPNCTQLQPEQQVAGKQVTQCAMAAT